MPSKSFWKGPESQHGWHCKHSLKGKLASPIPTGSILDCVSWFFLCRNTPGVSYFLTNLGRDIKADGKVFVGSLGVFLAVFQFHCPAVFLSCSPQLFYSFIKSDSKVLSNISRAKPGKVVFQVWLDWREKNSGNYSCLKSQNSTTCFDIS